MSSADAPTPGPFAPTPGGLPCYEPFGAPPGESPAPYSTFKMFGAPPPPSESPAPYSTFKLIPGAAPAPPSPTGSCEEEDYFSQDGGSSPEGIYVSADDVAALQQWAEERASVNERLNHVEQLASEREQEAAELRKRLEESEAALRLAQETAQAALAPAPAPAAAAAAAPAAAAERQPLRSMATLRHTHDEANALASQHKVGVSNRIAQENRSLLSELRKLKQGSKDGGVAWQQQQQQQEAAPEIS